MFYCLHCRRQSQGRHSSVQRECGQDGRRQSGGHHLHLRGNRGDARCLRTNTFHFLVACTVPRCGNNKARSYYLPWSCLAPQANNLVLHTAVEHFRRNCRAAEQEGHHNGRTGLPHIITSNVEHDSVKLAAEHLQREGKAGKRSIYHNDSSYFICCSARSSDCGSVADVTFVPVSKATARVEVEDVVAMVRPNTCLVSIMLANNETGVIMVSQTSTKFKHFLLGLVALFLLMRSCSPLTAHLSSRSRGFATESNPSTSSKSGSGS